MDTVYGLHHVTLRPGVTPTQFERFFRQQFKPALDALGVPGVAFNLLRADRGERAGEYLFMMTFDKIETRDRYFPEHNRPSPDLLSLIKPLQSLSATWESLSQRHKTDYVLLTGQ